MLQTPKVTIPDPMLGLEPGSWANLTVTVRFVDTVRRTLVENDFPEEIQTRLEVLIAEIPDSLIRPLDDPAAPDLDAWQRYIAPYDRNNWLQPPWFFVEHYFYRRILEATGYFQSGSGEDWDPFLFSKRQGLTQSQPMIAELASRLEGWLQLKQPSHEILQSLLLIDLWGNQADYSLWPADAEGDHKPDHADIDQASNFLLCDDSLPVVEYLMGLIGKPVRLDFLIDNAGMELISDLGFADYLLNSGMANEIHLHLKAHPTFVSDAVPADVQETVAFLEGADDSAIQALGKRLSLHLENQRMLLSPAYFWNSPLDGWQMPDSLRGVLSNADMVFSKGDANYRRLLGDRHWPSTTAFADIVTYFPAPLLALRTLKSELVCGLRQGQAEEITQIDPDWYVNGRWGLLQFFNPSG